MKKQEKIRMVAEYFNAIVKHLEENDGRLSQFDAKKLAIKMGVGTGLFHFGVKAGLIVKIKQGRYVSKIPKFQPVHSKLMLETQAAYRRGLIERKEAKSSPATPPVNQFFPIPDKKQLKKSSSNTTKQEPPQVWTKVNSKKITLKVFGLTIFEYNKA